VENRLGFFVDKHEEKLIVFVDLWKTLLFFSTYPKKEEGRSEVNFHLLTILLLLLLLIKNMVLFK